MDAQLYASHDLNMIRKAVEIQKLWEPKEGDWCIVEYGDIPIILGQVDEGEHEGELLNKFIKEMEINEWTWLPTQSQLQKIIKHEFEEKWSLINSFYHFAVLTPYKDGAAGAYYWLDSMEQLWLAFVMKEKFHKTWSPERKEWLIETQKEDSQKLIQK